MENMLLHPTLTDKVLSMVRGERKKQDLKWGEQNHDPANYFIILAEEHGEVAKEVVEYTFAQNKRPSMAEFNLVEELIQEAAVAVAMVESIIRRQKDQEIK